MDEHERTALMAAGIQAAAILIAGQVGQMAGRGANTAPDTAACARFAHDLLRKLKEQSWEDNPKPQLSRDDSDSGLSQCARVALSCYRGINQFGPGPDGQTNGPGPPRERCRTPTEEESGRLWKYTPIYRNLA